MKSWSEPADKKRVSKTVKSLKENGIEAEFVKTGEEAKKMVLDLIPEGSEVMTMSSVTLDTIGLSEEINKKDSRFKPVKEKLYAMDRQSQAKEMNRLGGAPEYALGSVHAVTENGSVTIASNTGSQLGAYAYGALKVIWVVGAQKIVKDTDEGVKRIYEYVLPLEDKRAKKAYGMGSNVSKLLIINKEIQPGRIKLILVGEALGF
ncbi:lactate utilization protein [Candidatus Daviesbacteria bacterium]|nr:lactate utilization protein [Candidatus Daviesbacteria bacterium]